MLFLAVDDKPINNKVIELDIEEYMDDKNFSDYKFVELESGKNAINFVKEHHVDILFLDIMMPVISGIDVLKTLRENKDIKQPIIIMVTALNDKKMRKKAKSLGADGYISKPFDNKEIYKVLDEYAKVESNFGGDDFFDFDEEDDFFDFDEEDSLEVQKDMMEDFNKSHKKVSAIEYLEEYDNIEYLLEELEEIEEDIYEHIDNLYEDNLDENIDSIERTLNKYSHFLNTFLEFQELSTSLNLLSRILAKCEFSEAPEKKRIMIAEFIKSILDDLVKWKNHVFVDQDAVDVFYLNASLLNSCIQLENILKEL